jgi:hypothetical protein
MCIAGDWRSSNYGQPNAMPQGAFFQFTIPAKFMASLGQHPFYIKLEDLAAFVAKIVRGVEGYEDYAVWIYFCSSTFVYFSTINPKRIGYSHQLGDRSDPKLSHQVVAMHLDGHLADSKFCRYLFVR